MSDKAVTLVHTVASLTPNSGVTPVILDFMRHRSLANLPSRCVYFDEGGAAHTHVAQLQGHASADLIAVRKPVSPWGQVAAFSKALADAVNDLRSKGHTVVIHDHGMWLPSNLAASRVAKRLQCPYVVSPHGMLQPQAMAQTSLKKRLAWHLYEKRRLMDAAFLHVTSAHEAQAVARRLPDARLVQVPLGVAVTPKPKSLTTRRQDIVYLGRLHPLKGISMLLQAWQEAKRTGWRLQLIGPCDEAYSQQLAREVAALQIGDSVTFVGPLYDADKDVALSESAVLVLPSFTENFGMVVAEALAHGLPVITTDATPWQDIANQGCGWVVPPQTRPLAEALRRAMNTPMHELGDMGLRGRAWMEASFDLSTVTNRMNEHYLELTGD